MATVTVTVRLRRLEGRARVLWPDLVQAVTDAVLEVEALEVDDVDGETASYEITKVTLVGHVDLDPGPQALCPWCGTPVEQPTGPGRHRMFCSPACRKASWRRQLSALPADRWAPDKED